MEDLAGHGWQRSHALKLAEISWSTAQMAIPWENSIYGIHGHLLKLFNHKVTKGTKNLQFDELSNKIIEGRDQKIRSVKLRELCALRGFNRLPTQALARCSSQPHSQPPLHRLRFPLAAIPPRFSLVKY